MSVLTADIGARFVDIALSVDGTLHAQKHPIGTHEPAAALLQAIDAVLARRNIAVRDLSQIRIGSTGAVNALMARTGPRIGLIVTRGFADTLALARQNRVDLYDPVARSAGPTFLVARDDIVEIDGRIAADGGEVEALDPDGLARTAAHFRECGIASIAVCLLFAHVAPGHERRCRDVLAAELPAADIVLSHEIDPQPREYERMVSTCVEAWLRPGETALMTGLADGLQARGFAGAIRFADAGGALVAQDQARRRVSSLLGNGPAAAIRLAAATARGEGKNPAIALDIGSTSTDFALTDAQGPALVDEAPFCGVPLRQKMVDMESMIMGGDSRFETGQGATAALSDAVAAYFFAARADAPGLPQAAARTVIDQAETEIAARIIRHAVRRNVDPAGAALVAMGGLGGVLACGIAEKLGMATVIVPAAPAAAGALGLLLSAPALSAETRIAAPVPDLSDASLARTARALAETLAAQDKTAPKDAPAALYAIRAAANGHMHGFSLRLGNRPPTVAAIRTAIDTHYRARYGVACPGEGYVFSLSARLEHTASTTLPALSGGAAQTGKTRSGVVATPCGDMVVRDGWSIARACNTHFLLTRSPHHG
ncbi:hydantoinase/oxoprolinase N-terminal domain-containing protein [Nitratireductor alexandrii]|uniref:hydantoinase/oxoprolinase N-terminal domain-containing protein n=1 Tax=Nitratireductor alexandrii TaxID=2448161 RepID=UPI000FD70785|nr:hydantoinase/oxoprolinase N-terminal domain-containing protein [Nitratireductor alexandrii]